MRLGCEQPNNVSGGELQELKHTRISSVSAEDAGAGGFMAAVIRDAKAVPVGSDCGNNFLVSPSP